MRQTPLRRVTAVEAAVEGAEAGEEVAEVEAEAEAHKCSLCVLLLAHKYFIRTRTPLFVIILHRVLIDICSFHCLSF
jgi:hypothetical protein